MNLLRGLAERPVEQAFQEEGLHDLLQLSYFKILNAMGNATLLRHSIGAYFNEIELIHQEIQNILAILSIHHGYDPEEYERCAIKKLTSGDDPIIPSGMRPPHVKIKPSAMRCIESTVAAVERQKGSKRLNIIMQKDIYYESRESMEGIRNYTLGYFDADRFREDAGSGGFEEGAAPPTPVDLYICEFHHNISMTKNVYHKEDIRKQILIMKEKGWFAKKCTVLIDTTIGFERSPDMRELLKDPQIRKMVDDGELNMVFMRSCQKFDMLGMDNYYGGVTITVNNDRAFSAFNERMRDPTDQLEGLSYQGMTHLQKCAGNTTDEYRQAIIDNTKLLYDAIPEAMIVKEGNTNSVQVSLHNSEGNVFLQVKTPYDEKQTRKIQSIIMRGARDKRLKMMGRPSFGFPLTNIVDIKFAGLRINPGLESKGNIMKIAEIFHAIQKGS
jgi:hypothetical protein